MSEISPQNPVKKTYYLPWDISEALRWLAFDEIRAQNDIVIATLQEYLAKQPHS